MRRRAARAGWGLAIGCALAGAAAPAADAARVTPSLEHLVGALGGDPAQASARRYDDLRKVSGSLAELGAHKVQGQAVAAPAAAAAIVVSRSDAALVDVSVVRPAATAARSLAAAGMHVTGVTDAAPTGVVEGYLPLGALGRAAGIGAVSAVTPVQGGGVDKAAARSTADEFGPGPGTDVLESVVAHNIVAAQAAAGTTGAGISVGVISDSINQVGTGVAGSQGSGDLPPNPNLVVLKDDSSSNVIDEGRAMAEVVYDEAPGLARILFASGSGNGAVKTGPVGKADSIRQLVANGAQVIADDIFYLDEPFFQDGAVSQAVDAAKAAGVAYFASAGNRARQSWEGGYADNGAGFHDFAGGDTIQTVTTVPAGKFLTVVLQWAEPFGVPGATDLDALLVRSTGAALPGTVTGGTDSNATTGIPRETVTWVNTSAGAIEVGLRIRRNPGSVRSPFMKSIARGNFPEFAIGEYATGSDTVNPDAAAARGALAVAAVNAADPGRNTPEPFSSRGPKARLFSPAGAALPAAEVRAKPELAAADRVATTFSLLPGTNPFKPVFNGTSAAAPSAAGIAALVRARKPALPVDLVYALMSEPGSAIPCEPAAGATPAADCGAGFVLADRVMARTLDATPPAVTPVLSPAAPTGRAGWYRGNVSVAWAVADPGSPVLTTGGCAPLTVASDGKPQLPCSALSAGGPASAAVTVKRDATPPAAPRLSGLTSRTYARSAVPAPRTVRCRSSDATSGLASCFVLAVPAAIGRHAARAVATDVAGNTASKTVAYRVVRDPGRARLRSAAAGGGKVTAKFAVPGKGRLDVVLTRRIGRRTVTLARGRAAARRTGSVTVTLRLTAAGRRALGRRGAAVRGTLAATFRDPATLGSSRAATTRRFVAS
ncbi:MAG: S8 family serine peptidase [Solirubrobacteraceae bacterium]